jgi:hypothetical protein
LRKFAFVSFDAFKNNTNKQGLFLHLSTVSEAAPALDRRRERWLWRNPTPVD